MMLHVIINILEEENMTNGYIIEGAKYDKDGDYFVFKLDMQVKSLLHDHKPNLYWTK